MSRRVSTSASKCDVPICDGFIDLEIRITQIEVVQEGVVRIEPARSFAEAGLHPVMLQNVKLAGYIVPTPIQSYCMPAVFKGYDLVACAQTGTSIFSITSI
jgi:superfamily II DNA/RNA helicase